MQELGERNERDRVGHCSHRDEARKDSFPFRLREVQYELRESPRIKDRGSGMIDSMDVLETDLATCDPDILYVERIACDFVARPAHAILLVATYTFGHTCNHGTVYHYLTSSSCKDTVSSEVASSYETLYDQLILYIIRS